MRPGHNLGLVRCWDTDPAGMPFPLLSATQCSPRLGVYPPSCLVALDRGQGKVNCSGP